MTPAKGALNPAEIAAATPHPIKISGFILNLKYFLMNRPIVEPKWTRGPYCPTDPPPLITINAARVDPKPFLVSDAAFSLCAAYIESAGPAQRVIFSHFLNPVIKSAASRSETILERE